MDYCTMFLEGWWSTCCKAHDEAYTAQIGKAVADSQLFSCVAHSDPTLIGGVVSVAVAGAVWAGVKLFGKRFYKAAKPKV